MDRGSDERQYCAPGIDLPICGFSRTKYGEYKEYHTSEDNLNFVSKKGLKDSFEVLKSIVESFENYLRVNFFNSKNNNELEKKLKTYTKDLDKKFKGKI